MMDLYQLQGTIGCLVSVVLIHLVGGIFDKVSPKIMVPMTILARGSTFYIISQIQDPSNWSFLVIVPLMHFVYHSSALTISAYQQSMYPKEIRGLLTSFASIISSVGSIGY